MSNKYQKPTKEMGDPEAYARLLEHFAYAEKHHGRKFYDKVQKLLIAVQHKGKADIELIRWLFTDIQSFHPLAQGRMAQYVGILHGELVASDLQLDDAVIAWLCDEYQRAFINESFPITIQEQLLTKYDYILPKALEEPKQVEDVIEAEDVIITEIEDE